MFEKNQTRDCSRIKYNYKIVNFSNYHKPEVVIRAGRLKVRCAIKYIQLIAIGIACRNKNQNKIEHNSFVGDD